MNYQTYRLKRKIQEGLLSVEEIILFPEKALFDHSRDLQQWLLDRDKKKRHKQRVKRITESIFQAVEVEGRALVCTANLSDYSLEGYFDTCGKEVREIMRTPKWGEKNGLSIHFVKPLDFECIAPTYGIFKLDVTERLELQRLHNDGHRIYIIERK